MDGDWICNFLSPCQELPLGCAWPKFFFSLAISALSGPPTSLPFFPENYLQNWFPLLQTNIMGTWGGKKNLGLWWIRAVRCFQVSFVFVLLPVRFFVFPATGNCAPAHAVPMVHGYHPRICPSPDVITVLSLLSITVMQTTTANRLPLPFTPGCNWSPPGDTACPTRTVTWLLQPQYRSLDLPDLLHPAPPILLCLIQLILAGGFPALRVLIDQTGSSACHLVVPQWHVTFT